MTSVYQLLQLLPDAREDGRLDDVLDEIGIDVAYVRFETRRLPMKPYFAAAEYLDEDEVEESHARARQRYRDEFRKASSMQWARRASYATLASFDAILKQHYRPEHLGRHRDALPLVGEPRRLDAWHFDPG